MRGAGQVKYEEVEIMSGCAHIRSATNKSREADVSYSEPGRPVAFMCTGKEEEEG